MNHLIQSVSEAFIRRLPSGTRYFTLSDLKNADFPEFLVRRIAMELENNLAESIVPPKSDWADMQAEPVIAAWEHFLYAIHEATRMPSAHARTVIETSIEDMLELLVEPRRQTVSYLFGRDESLTVSELAERVDWLVVYRHFGEALVRYAGKKGLSNITQSVAQKVISAVDDRIVSGFTPLTWTQSLDEFFMLVGERAEPDLLARYFADRNRPRLAILLGNRNAAISRTELVELLSQPSFDEESSEASYLRYEPVKSFPQAETEPEVITAPSDPVSETVTPAFIPIEVEPSAHIPVQGHEEEEAEETQEPEIAPELDVAPPVELLQEVEADEERTAPELDTMLHFEVETPEIENEDTDDAPVAPDAFDYPVAVPPEPEIPLHSRFESAQKQNPAMPEAEEKPLWLRFRNEEAEEKPLIDLTQADPLPDPYAIKRIEFHLSDKRNDFLLEIFAGDNDQFEEVIRMLSTFPEWPPAGKYIAGQVFKLNKIDMYSDIGVDFLDRVQSYFLEKKG